MARPFMVIKRKTRTLEMQFHFICYGFNKDSVLSIRTISDLAITLENEKGEDIEIRTKKIDEA